MRDMEKARVYAARYYAENTEKERARNARYRAKYPEKVRARHVRYYAARSEERREYQVRYYAENTEKVLTKDARYRAETKLSWLITVDSCSRSLLRSANNRCKKLNLPFDLSLFWITQKVQEAVDAGLVTCETHNPMNASIDQIIPGKGYTQGNVQIVPAWYNFAKQDYPEKELLTAIDKWYATRTKRRERNEHALK